MTTPAPPNGQNTTAARILFVACELREKTWKLGFTTGHDTVAEFAEPPF